MISPKEAAGSNHYQKRTGQTALTVRVALVGGGLLALAVSVTVLSIGPMQPVKAQAGEEKALAQARVAKPRARLGTLRFRHTGVIRGLALSPKSKILATCGDDGLACLWDSKTGEAIQRFSSEGEPLRCIAISEDGRWVASGGYKGMLYLWEVPTGRQVKAWKIDLNGVVGLAFAPDGRTLASLGFDHEVCLWEIPSTTKLWSWREDARGLFFSPDGKTLATFVKNDPPRTFMPGGSLLFVDPNTGLPRGNMAQPEDLGVGFAFSPDGRTCAIGGRDGIVRLWDLPTGKKLQVFKGHSRLVFRVAFSPDGKTLASVSSPSDIRFWDVPAGKERCRIQGATHQISDSAFSDDGKVLYTGGDDHVIRRWDISTGQELDSSDGQGAITALAMSPDGRRAVTVGKDALLRTWDLATGQPVRHYRGHQWPPTSVAFSPDGRFLASGGGWIYEQRMNELRLWDTDTGKELRRWDGLPRPVSQLGFLANGSLLAVVPAWPGPLHVWDTATGKERSQFGDKDVLWPGFSPDGTLLTLWGNDAVRIWDVANQRLVRELQPNIPLPGAGNGAAGYRSIFISAHALSPGGRYLACAARHEDGIIHLFQVATGEEVASLQVYRAAGPPIWREAIRALAWTHDGLTLISGDRDGRVLLWDLATSRAVLRGEGHQGPATMLAISADDRTLLSGSDDTTALIWDLPSAPNGKNLSPTDLDALWSTLADGASSKAFRAIFTLAAVPQQTVPFLQQHLKASAPMDTERITQLLADLDSNQFAVRQRATQELQACGELAEPALRKKLQAHPSAEVRRRIEQVLEKLKPDQSGGRLRALRAVEILEYMSVSEAEGVLRTLAKGAPEARLTQEAKASLERLAKRQVDGR